MTAVLLFVRAPRLGRVKTRLAADIGPEAALALYRDVGLRVARSVRSGHPLTVWFDPPDAKDEMREWLGPGYYIPQCGGDLGERMVHAFGVHFARGDRRVVVIGADTPGVTAETVTDALRRLESADLVIGPSVDGGYYLLGLCGPQPALFEGIAWGSGDVCQITVARARIRDLRVGELGALRDLDRAEDLEALGIPRP